MKKWLSLVTLGLLASGTQAQSTKTRLNHTAIYVTNLEKSAAFYRDIIGLDTIPEPFHDGKHVWLSTGPGSALHIISGAPGPKEYYKSQHTCYSVPSIEVLVEKLKKAGLNWEDWDGKPNGITTRVDGVKQLWLKDPDGYWVEINNDRPGFED